MDQETNRRATAIGLILFCVALVVIALTSAPLGEILRRGPSGF